MSESAVGTGNEPMAGGGFVWDETTVTLVAIGGVIVFLVLLLVVVGCMICRLKPDSSFATQYRASVARVSNYGNRGGGGGRPLKKTNSRANALRDDDVVDANPMFNQQFRTATDLSTLMGGNIGSKFGGNGSGQSFGDTQAFVAGMHFGAAPTFDQFRPAQNMYQQIPSEPNGRRAEAIALWDFNGQVAGDLVFKAGQRIELLQHTKQWWIGRCNGKEGPFPANYVVISRASVAFTQSAAPEPFKPNKQVAARRQSVYNPQLHAPQHQQHHAEPQQTYSLRAHANKKQGAAGAAGDDVARQAVALYDFPGEEVGDLQLRRGDIIDLIDWQSDWWEGVVVGRQDGTVPDNLGQIGVCSRNYLQLLIR